MRNQTGHQPRGSPQSPPPPEQGSGNERLVPGPAKTRTRCPRDPRDPYRALAWRPNGEVEKPISVEIARRQSFAELITAVGDFRTDIRLKPHPIAREAKAVVARTGEHPDDSDVIRRENRQTGAELPALGTNVAFDAPMAKSPTPSPLKSPHARELPKRAPAISVPRITDANLRAPQVQKRCRWHAGVGRCQTVARTVDDHHGARIWRLDIIARDANRKI